MQRTWNRLKINITQYGEKFYLTNKSALAVNCWVIIHCLEVIYKEDQTTSAKRKWFICWTVNYYSTIHALELIYFDSNTQETMKKQLYPSDSSNFPPIELRNRSALAVNCWVIDHCLEVSCEGDQITISKREWFIYLQLTDKQWFITQQFTHQSWSISILTHKKRWKKQSEPSDPSSFPPLHKEIPPKKLTVIQAFTCISYVFNAKKRRYTV